MVSIQEQFQAYESLCQDRKKSLRKKFLKNNPAGGNMMRIYVAGAYSANNLISGLDNMRRGIRWGLEVLLAGYAPFVPWFDYHFQLMLRDGESLTVKHYQYYSMAWLVASDAVLVVPGSKNSKGTQEEIKVARSLGIPVYYSLKDRRLLSDRLARCG